MDLSGENSGDSVEIDNLQLLAATQPLLPTEITIQDSQSLLNGVNPVNTQNPFQPRVVIHEQPQQRGFRFRYECEGPSHGGLQGEKTERSRKTHPSITVENYNGPARIEVSLVTDTQPPKIHAHKLVGKNCTDGICKMELSSTAGVISFPNLCVLHVTRKKAADVLLNRIIEDVKLTKRIRSGNMTLDPQTTAEESLKAKTEAHEQARSMSLNVVRLQFRVFLPNTDGQYVILLPPVVSQPIYDSKSPGASALKICRMDKYGGCCTGNEEVFLLCEKVQKEDIAVRFVERNDDGSVKWEAYGNFSPLDVHRQYAIVFKTPAYYNANIDKAVNVMIMLQRKSDAEVSEAKAFTYYPQNRDKDNIARKKRKTLPLDSTFNYYSGDGGPGGGASGAGGGFGSSGPSVPNGSMGGNGRGNSQGNYSVIMPNGTIVDELAVLPTTVEQVVKEEFARCHSESPDTISTEDSNQSFIASIASPFDPMLWTGTLDDLEIDAALSITNPFSANGNRPELPSKSVPLIEQGRPMPVQSGPGDYSAMLQMCSNANQLDYLQWERRAEDPAVLKGLDIGVPASDSGDGFVPDTDCVDGLMPKIDVVDGLVPDKDVVDGLMPNVDVVDGLVPDKDVVDGLVPDSRKGGRLADINSSEMSKANCEVSAEGKDWVPKLTNVVTAPDDQSRRDQGSDSVRSPTMLSETTASEGFRTDEGFSEVSEEASSMKEDVLPKKIIMQETRPPPKTTKKKEAKGLREKAPKPVKVATSVVKRVMEKLTAKTVHALQDYAETGDARYLLIVQRHLMSIKNENGDLPIHLAVINNQTSSLRHLLDIMNSLPNASRAINTYNYMRQTALHLAAIMQQSFHIELLLHGGANPSLADRNGNTPSHLAVINNSLDALRSLIKYLRPGVTASNPFPELDYLNFDGYTPVHLATQNSNVDMLRLLVHGKANVDMPDGKSGRTALHHAVELDDLPVAGFLLMEADADVNARCFDGNTPLHIACCRGLIGMVALLMTAGAITDVENEEVPADNTPLMEAECREERKEREEVTRKGQRGLQPVDYAAGKDRLQIISMLTGEQLVSDDDPCLSLPSDDDPCLPLPSDDLEKDSENLITHKTTYDSGLATSLSSQSASSIPLDSNLSYGMRLELSKLLDPVQAGKDVFALAARLGYHDLVAALEVMGCSGSSPTHFLLDYNETYGSVSKLKECLQAIDREDAVRLIEAGDKGLLWKQEQAEQSVTDT